MYTSTKIGLPNANAYLGVLATVKLSSLQYLSMGIWDRMLDLSRVGAIGVKTLLKINLPAIEEL